MVRVLGLVLLLVLSGCCEVARERVDRAQQAFEQVQELCRTENLFCDQLDESARILLVAKIALRIACGEEDPEMLMSRQGVTEKEIRNLPKDLKDLERRIGR
jgi:hypothetical protein